MAAISLTATEQAAVAAVDALLDQAFTSGMNNPDTSVNTAAMQGYALAAAAGRPPQDYRPTVRAAFKEVFLSALRGLTSGTEAYTEVGSGGTAPAFQNAWANYNTGFNTAAFYRNPFGEVKLKGRVKSGTAGTTIFVLPAGYRPPLTTTFVAATGSGIVELQVDGAGDVFCTAGGNVYVSLDGVSFRATQ